MTATGYIGGDPTKVDVAGWTLGDVLAANAAGSLEAVPVGAAAEVLTVVPAEPTDLGYAATGGGGGFPLVSESGPVTSGNIVAAADTYTALGPEVSVAASVGDIIGVIIEALAGVAGATLVFDAATRVAAADVNYLSTGTGTRLFPGARPPWYVVDTAGPFVPAGGEVRYVVQAGDVSAGTVTVQAYAAGEGSPRTVRADASFPLRVWVTNYGPGTP